MKFKDIQEGNSESIICSQKLLGEIFTKTLGLQCCLAQSVVSGLPSRQCGYSGLPFTESQSCLWNKLGFLPLAFRIFKPHNRGFI